MSATSSSASKAAHPEAAILAYTIGSMQSKIQHRIKMILPASSVVVLRPRQQAQGLTDRHTSDRVKTAAEVTTGIEIPSRVHQDQGSSTITRAAGFKEQVELNLVLAWKYPRGQ